MRGLIHHAMAPAAPWPCLVVATRTLAPTPNSAQAAFRAYRPGLVPIGGASTGFNSTLPLDSADPAVTPARVLAAP